MKKFLLLLSPFVVALSFCFFCESKLETHSIFYVSGENVYENLMQDSSFDFAPAFWLLDHVSALKSKIQTGEYELKKGENVISLAYQGDVREGQFIPGCVSRKKHIVPVIMEILEN